MRGSYPKGYIGDVRIVLNGVEELERADGFLVTHPQPMPAQSSAVTDGDGPAIESLSRAPGRKMED